MTDKPENLAPAPFAQHRHPRCVRASAGVIAQGDAALIADLRRDLAATTEDRDNLLQYLARITAALGLPEGCEIDKVVQRAETLAGRGATP